MLALHSASARVLRPFDGSLPAEFAAEMLSSGFTDSDKARYAEQAHRAQLGELNDEERVEPEDWLTTTEVLTILHVKARASLTGRRTLG